nr:MAG TPA: hypothetical protein [Bacteriophage sp.]
MVFKCSKKKILSRNKINFVFCISESAKNFVFCIFCIL